MWINQDNYKQFIKIHNEIEVQNIIQVLNGYNVSQTPHGVQQQAFNSCRVIKIYFFLLQLIIIFINI